MSEYWFCSPSWQLWRARVTRWAGVRIGAIPRERHLPHLYCGWMELFSWFRGLHRRSLRPYEIKKFLFVRLLREAHFMYFRTQSAWRGGGCALGIAWFFHTARAHRPYGLRGVVVGLSLSEVILDPTTTCLWAIANWNGRKYNASKISLNCWK